MEARAAQRGNEPDEVHADGWGLRRLLPVFDGPIMIAKITRRWNSGVCLLGLSVAFSAAAAGSQPLQRSIESGGWTIEFSEKAGKATHPRGGTVVLWQQPPEEAGCELSESGALLSVVGTIVSFERKSSGYCQGWAHPSSEAGFEMIDLARAEGSRDVTLYDFFDERQLARELQRASNADPVLRESAEDSCGFTTASASSFAFHHVVGDKVSLRASLRPGCTAGGGYTIEIELILRPRREMLPALRRAEKAGRLMNRLAPFRE